MKILIFITKSNWGGAQRYVYDLATHLPKNDYDVEVLAGGNGVLINRLKEAGVKADGTLPIGRDVSFLEDAKAFFRLCSLIKEKKPDVIHLNSSKIGGLGALAGRICGVKRVIFTCHGFAFKENRPLHQKVILKFIYWIMIMLAHTTITVSEAAKFEMRNWPFIYKKITVIYNGIEPEAGFSKINARGELMKLSPTLKKAYSSVPEKNIFWIGTNAELHHIKGHDYAIRGIHDLVELQKQKKFPKKIIYTIISTGEEREKLEKTIVELGLQDTIFLLGFVPHASQYISAFDVFLLASLHEGLPYVLLEAGLSRLPVISTTVGGIPEVIEDMRSGILIQPRRSTEIRHALEFIISHKAVQKEYGNALRAHITTVFTIENMIAKTEEVYHVPIRIK